MLVRDVMTSPAVTIRPVDEVAETARVLDRLDLTSLPVVDDDLITVVALMSGTPLKSIPVLLHDRVVGMVSRRDVVRAMVRGELVPYAEASA
jgi:CBS domain-containing protein